MSHMLVPTQGGYEINNRWLYNQGESYTIWDALQVDDVVAFESFIKDYALNPNEPNQQGYTFAFLASKNGSYKCLKFLIDLGAKISEKDLDAALKNKHYGCADLLRSILRIDQQQGNTPIEEQKNDYVEEEKTSYAAKFKQMEERIHQQEETLKRHHELINKLTQNRQETALNDIHHNKNDVKLTVQAFSPLISSADQLIALSKDLQTIDQKQLRIIDDKEEIALVLNTLEPIRKTYSLPRYLLPIYFECCITSSFLLEKLEAPFEESSKEWKTLISVAKQTHSMKGFPYEIQKHLRRMQTNERRFQQLLSQLGMKDNQSLAEIKAPLRRRIFIHSIESVSTEFPFLKATKNLLTNIQNMPLHELLPLTALIQRLKLPHKLLQSGSFLASLFYKIHPKSSEFTTLNELITQIEGFLNNQNYQLAHDDLLIIRDHYQNFIKKMCSAETEQEKANLTSPTLPILYCASAYPRLLNPKAQELLLNKEKSNQYGTHLAQSYNGIHWKQDPYAPGVEYMVHSISTLIGSPLSPITELVKIKQGQSCFIYQASQTVEGESLDFILMRHPDLLDKINPHNFSFMCTLGLIIDPQDGKPDNYMAKLIVNAKKEVISCSLIGIDNDIAFANPIIEKSNKSHSIEVKNVLYFFPQMENPIDPIFKRDFCCLCPEVTAIKWLKSLYKKNEEYEELYQQSIFTRQELKNLKLPIRLAPNFAQKLTKKLHLIKEAMLSKKDLTHNELFARTHPILCKYYCAIKTKHKDPLEAVKSLYRRNAETIEEKLDTSKFQLALATKKAKKWDFEDQKNEDIKTALENFIAKTNFATLTAKEQQAIFSELAECSRIEYLTIRNSAAFSKNIIENLRSRLPNLKSLTLDGCHHITQEDLLYFISSPSLKNIQLTLGKNGLLKRKQWNFLAHHFKNFRLQIPKTKKLIPINKIAPNLLLQQMIISCPEETEIILFALDEKKANPNMLAPTTSPLKGKNSLHLAASYNLLEPLKLLIAYGGDIAIKDYSGKTPLDRALDQDKNGSHQELIDYLIQETKHH